MRRERRLPGTRAGVPVQEARHGQAEAIVPRLEPLGNICKTVGKDLTATTKLINTASCLGLANLVAKKPGVREKGVASLCEIFGGPGLLAMLKLKPEAQATALDRFVGLTQAYRMRVQLGDVSQSVIEHLLVSRPSSTARTRRWR